MQILLTISYDGTSYAGWQRQKNAISVQQTIEEAMESLLKQKITLRSASRTDAGVHALGQRASFFVDTLKIPLFKLPSVINGYLPDDIAIINAEIVPESFSPRYDAVKKTYHYKIYNRPAPNPLLSRYSAFVPTSLDTAAMIKAAPLFVGVHDFKAFMASSPDTKGKEVNTVREIFDCSCKNEGNMILITVAGNGFLYNMVRIISGTILYVGLGKIHPDKIPAIIEQKNRQNAGKTMPPQGLTLVGVEY